MKAARKSSAWPTARWQRAQQSDDGRRTPRPLARLGCDHNSYVFTNWLCGGGINGGTAFGESDQCGYKPLDRDNPTYVWDIHAMLRLLGLERTKLTVRHNSIDRRLTDVHGRVIKEITA